MHFSTTALLALFAATTALALPAANDRRNFITSAVHDVEDGAKDVGHAVESGAGKAVSATESAVKGVPSDLTKAFGPDCDAAKCAAALGPAAVGCGIAAGQGFADPLSDIPCLAAAINTVANKPASCAQCHVPKIPGLKE